MQVLAEAFIVRENEGLVFLNRAAQRSAELVSLKRRRGTLVEKVGRVESIVAQIFKHRSVPLICSGLRDDRDLAAGMLAIFARRRYRAAD